MAVWRSCRVIALLGLILGLTAPAYADTTVFVPSAQAKRVLTVADQSQPGGDRATLNLLAVYSTRFKQQLAAEGYAVADYLQRSYVEVNRFFANTGLQTRIRLAGLVEWQLPAGSPIATDNVSLIDFVEGPRDLRDKFAADLVQLWEVTEAGVDDPQVCGWAQVIGPQRQVSSTGFGYSTLARGQQETPYAGCYAGASPELMAQLVAHEIGHNLGSTHAWGEGNGEGAFEFSHGQLCGDPRGGYPQGTLMSTSGYRLPFFSAPELHRDGEACGIDAERPYPADNRETFTRTAGVIASLRPSLNASSQVRAATLAQIGELSGALPVVLSRDRADSAGSVELLVQAESARAGEDFRPASQTVNFPAGVFEVTVWVELYADDRHEGDETLLIWLQKPQGLKIAGGRGFRVTITDAQLTTFGATGQPLAGQSLAPVLPGSDLTDSDPKSVVSSAAGGAAAPAGGSGGGGSLGWLLLCLAGSITGRVYRGARMAPPRNRQ